MGCATRSASQWLQPPSCLPTWCTSTKAWDSAWAQWWRDGTRQDQVCTMWTPRGRVCGDLFAVGSGSMYAYGILDSGLHKDLTVKEACELARRAIYQATFRDAYSGGQVNLYHVHSEGWTRVSQDDVLLLHQQYAEKA